MAGSLRFFPQEQLGIARRLFITLAAVFLLLISDTRAWALSGDLDPTFGTGGIVVVDSGTLNGFGQAIALQNDGKILIGGLGNGDFALARYDTNGALDPSFGGDGVVTTTLTFEDDYIQGLAVQSDGKIVAAGLSLTGLYWDVAVVRYNGDGSLDETFDGDGIVKTPIGPNHDEGYAVALQSDGKIVVAGFSDNGGPGFEFAVVRYDPNGTLDAGFAGDGTVTTAIGASFSDTAFAVAIQNDGKIVVGGGATETLAQGHGFAAVRYNDDGTLDTGFDGDGIVTTYFSGDDTARGIALQNDGKIVLVGASAPVVDDDTDFALVRYNSDGTLDGTFDEDGKVTTDFGAGDARAQAVVVQGDGKLVVAGFAGDSVGLARYHTDGTLDTTFGGGDGLLTTHIELGGDTRGWAAALQNDGKVVVAGWTIDSVGSDWALLRYLGTIPCTPAPLPTASCLEADQLQLLLKYDSDPARRRLKWKWSSGDAFGQPELGVPNLDTSYRFCLYDTTIGVPSLAMSVGVAPGVQWKDQDPRGWRYRDRESISDGASKVQLTTGSAGTTKGQLIARGSNLPMPTPIDAATFFDQDPSVVVQLISSTGTCLTSEFTTAKRNDGVQFKAKTP